MKQMVDDIEALVGKTIKEIRYQKDNDYNQGVLIATTDGDVCFLHSCNEDNDIYTYSIQGLSKWNAENALQLGVITPEEYDKVMATEVEQDNRLKVGSALRYLDEVRKAKPELLTEFSEQLKKAIE